MLLIIPSVYNNILDPSTGSSCIKVHTFIHSPPPPQSFRYYPTNIDVISWLGAYYMDSQFADKAVHYFERAALIQ